MTPLKNTFPHPVTGENLYSPEELDAVTTQYIEDQCAVLAKNLKKRKKDEYLSDYEYVFDTPVPASELLKSF